MINYIQIQSKSKMAACLYCQIGAEHRHRGACAGCDMIMLEDDFQLIYEPEDLSRFYCTMCQSWLNSKIGAANYFSQFVGDHELVQFYLIHFGSTDRAAVKAQVEADFGNNTRLKYLKLKGLLFDRIGEIRAAGDW